MSILGLKPTDKTVYHYADRTNRLGVPTSSVLIVATPMRFL